MIHGDRILLRPVKDEDWSVIENWGQDADALWGPYQRFQLDHLPALRKAYEATGLLKRESGLLLIEEQSEGRVVGFVRYTLLPYPDSDFPCLEIGFCIPAKDARGHGYAQEAVKLLVHYLFAGHATQRIMAFTDAENIPAQRVLEKCGFDHEGTLRRAMFRQAAWHDVRIYAILRNH